VTELLEIVRSGRAVDGILLLVVLEGVALAVWLRRTGRASRVPGIVATLVAGAALLLGLRAALAGAHPVWIVLALTAALLAHLVDLVLRLRGSR
jgi:hypothetical protein